MIFSDQEINSHVKYMLEKRLEEFGHLNYAYAIMNKRNTSQMSVITNIPDWVNVYLENSYQNIDPVIITALQRLTSFTWDEGLIINDKWKLPKIFNTGKDYDIISGYTFVLNDNNDHLVVLSLMINKFIEADLYSQIDKKRETIQYILISIHEMLLNAYQNKVKEKMDTNELSNRENEILDLCCTGKTYPEIAHTLNISVSTVKFHMGRIVKKMGVKNAKHAISIRSEINSSLRKE